MEVTIVGVKLQGPLDEKYLGPAEGLRAVLRRGRRRQRRPRPPPDSRRRDPRALRVPRLPPAGGQGDGRPARHAGRARVRPARQDVRGRRGPRDGRGAGVAAVPVPRGVHRAGEAGRGVRAGGRVFAGVPAVVLPVVVDAGRGTDATRRGGATAGQPARAGEADARRQAGGRVRGKLRRPVAPGARRRERADRVPQDHRPRDAATAQDPPGRRPATAAVAAGGSRAVLRARRPRGPQRARVHRQRLHVPERAAGRLLRHPRREGHTTSARSRCPRTARAAGC